MKSQRNMRCSRRLAPLLGALLAGAYGCETQAPSPSSPSAPPPAHPAVKEPSVEGSSSKSAMPTDPHGHPPVAAPGAGSPAPGAGASTPAPAAPPSPARPGALAEKLAGHGLSVQVPAGWVEESGSRPMRIATLKLPRVEGDPEDGELSVSAVGGGLEQNVERWRGQFQEKPQPVLEKKDVNGFTVTRVEMDGTFSAGMMAQPAPPKPGTKLIGIIVEVPGSQELIFFKAWGPKATMERWKPAFQELAASFRKAG